jgi:outer membrane protein OmpU
MRKYLLSTSALAGAALLSSAALADLSITGSVEFEYSDSDSNIAANDTKAMASNNEIYVDFTTKTDSGLTIAYGVDIDGDAGAGTDDNQLSVSGGFGTIVMGQTDGVSDTMAITAQGLIAEETDGTATGGTVIKDSGPTPTGNADRVSYTLPAMGGLMAGVSFKEADTASVTEYGVNYSMEAGGASITIGHTGATQEVANAQDLDTTNTGVSVAMGALSVTISNGTSESAGEDLNGNGVGAKYTLGNGLTLAAVTFKSEDDIDTGEEYSVNHYEAIYPIASGLSAVITVSDFDYEGGTSGNGGADENGTITTLNIKASF